MNRMFYAILIFLAILLLFSCCANTPVSHRNTGEPDMLGDLEGWITVGENYPYEKVGNIHPGKIPEVWIDIGAEQVSGQMEDSSDGFVYAAMKPTAENAAKNELKKPLVRKYDKTGKLMWEIEYEHGTATGNINNLVIFPDDGFLFAVQTYPRYVEGSTLYEKGRVVRCGKNGEVLWEHEFDDFSGNMLQKAVLAENEEIFIIGTGRMKNGVQTKEDAADTISVMKLDSGGNLLEQKWFGGSDFDYVYSAAYNHNTGLILWGATQSHDGDFAIDSNLIRNDFIACIDSEIKLQWVVHTDKNSGYSTVPYLTQNGEIYILGSIQQTGNKPKGLLIKLDGKGNTIWEKQIYDDFWGRSLEQAENGDIIIAKGYGENGMIAVVDPDGNEKKLLTDLPFCPGQITPVETGGFIVTATRIIGNLPQPPYISSIWYDTELVAVKYGSDYELEWRKTYDRYKNQLGTDSAWLQRDGSIVLPK